MFGWVQFFQVLFKIILLGIISKGGSAETSGKTDRTVTREDETQPPLLSAKRAKLTTGSSGRISPLMTVPLLPQWGVGGRGGILSGYGSNKSISNLNLRLVRARVSHLLRIVTLLSAVT